MDNGGQHKAGHLFPVSHWGYGFRQALRGFRRERREASQSDRAAQNRRRRQPARHVCDQKERHADQPMAISAR